MFLVYYFKLFDVGFSNTVTSVCAVYLVGTENIAGAQGFLNLFYGVAAFISVPFTGK